ncbi:hypothetical protein O181_059216 [Austropuccinia psidii MF-1]|uniref:Uncharacterized protein n=1 Tax=Austropuccinia psidii MF-1 TaxID=1389203 RepID=A0A9Q3EIJ6_9BASI|nr:hypothetical protein [Austropuccinia psidii MF-1]
MCRITRARIWTLSKNKSLEEYDVGDEDYVAVEDNGLGMDDVTPPKQAQSLVKRRRVQSNVYDYFEKLNPNGEWVKSKGNFRFTYKCPHCSVKLAIIGCNTSNLNKHRG